VSAVVTLPSSTKAELVERSAMARLRLRRDARALRDTMHWKRAAASLATAPVARAAAVGIVLSIVGASRASRFLAIAGRLLVAARLASTVVRAVRDARARRDVRQRTDAGPPSP
jgi:hypothetical protein